LDKLSSRMTAIDNDYGTCERTEATLAIYNVDSDLVTQKLNIVPTSIQKIGVPRIMPSGVKRNGTMNTWLFSSDDCGMTSKDLRIHLTWLLDKIKPNESQLLEIQQVSGVKMAIRCRWESKYGDGGPTLWPEQMERMAKLNLEWTCSFSHYGSGLQIEE
jgi:hypothetical protein